LKSRIWNELLLIDLVVILLILAILNIPDNALRIIIGIPFLLFFPGYVLISALFPRQQDIGGIERVALSFGLSIAVVPLIGLILNFTEWGIRLEPVLYSVSAFVLVMSIIAMIRRAQVPNELRFGINIESKSLKKQRGPVDKLLTALVVITILGALTTLIYVVSNPKVGEKFTEFYILGLNDMASDYPVEFTVEKGQVVSIKYGNDENNIIEERYGRVTLGIINREQQTASYSIEILIDGNPIVLLYKGQLVDRIASIILEHDGKWEQEIGFAPLSVGQEQKVEFLLYLDGSLYFDDSLHIWIDVIQG